MVKDPPKTFAEHWDAELKLLDMSYQQSRQQKHERLKKLKKKIDKASK